MDNEQLQQWVEHISMTCFHRPFLHLATFNQRLRSTGGRYFPHTHHIDISWRQFETFGEDEVEKIIKHELCHYHLHLMNRGYKHQDKDFKLLLKQVGGSRFCKNMPEKRKLPYRYILKCKNCGFEYLRKRKVNIKKYRCGRCKGKLAMYEYREQQVEGVPQTKHSSL